jgi:hypothetical protein
VTTNAAISEDYSLERCREIKREVFSLLLERRYPDSDVAVLHLLLAGRTVTHQFIGKVETMRDVVLRDYEGCEIRECGRLDYQKPEQAWPTATPVKEFAEGATAR